MKKILLLVFLLLVSVNLFADTNMKIVGIVDLKTNKLTVKAGERNVLVKTLYNKIDLNYGSKERFVKILEEHIPIVNKAQELDVKYYRSTSQFIDSENNTKIMFSVSTNYIFMKVSTDGQYTEDVRLTVEEAKQLIDLINNAVEDKKELDNKIQTLNEMVDEVKKI
jgi:polyhydroxyalkanoate synthesis regulator phasin